MHTVKTRTLLFVFGTRPEAIKLAPLILQFRKNEKFAVKVCITAQHREMLDQVMRYFNITADYDLNIMQAHQSLFDVTARALTGLEKVIDDCKPECIFVQGDTTTAFTGALAAYYKKVKVAHVEAGLRSGSKYSPFPEEGNRLLTGGLADFHFAPTAQAIDNLSKENIHNNVFLVGNTVIDALFLGLEINKANKPQLPVKIQADRKIVLITGHRRESFGEPFMNICNAIKELAEKYPAYDFIYPVHLNPNVQKPVYEVLNGLTNVHLIAPLDYAEFIELLSHSHIVLTDSGGLQEEAPSLGKPVLVMRDVTERMEGVEAGTAKLVGTDKVKIVTEMEMLLNNKSAYDSMAKAVNPYGDGTACEKICRLTEQLLFD